MTCACVRSDGDCAAMRLAGRNAPPSFAACASACAASPGTPSCPAHQASSAFSRASNVGSRSRCAGRPSRPCIRRHHCATFCCRRSLDVSSRSKRSIGTATSQPTPGCTFSTTSGSTWVSGNAVSTARPDSSVISFSEGVPASPRCAHACRAAACGCTAPRAPQYTRVSMSSVTCTVLFHHAPGMWRRTSAASASRLAASGSVTRCGWRSRTASGSAHHSGRCTSSRRCSERRSLIAASSPTADCQWRGWSVPGRPPQAALRPASWASSCAMRWPASSWPVPSRPRPFSLK